MSKKRSISRKVNLLDFHLPDSSKILPNSDGHSKDSCIQEIYFGERIKSESGSCSTSTKSDTSDVFTSDDGLQYLLSYKSSGSSTSGSEDIEIEATKKVIYEFDKLDSILYGEAEAASKEVNEYNQWTDNFPHLRIVGSAMKIHPSNEENVVDFYEEVIAEHSDKLDSTLVNEENPPNTKAKIKEAVINNVLKEVKSRLVNKNREPYQIFSIPDVLIPTNRRDRKISEKSSSVKDSDSNSNEMSTSESFLQVTTVPLHCSPFRRTNFEYQSPIMKSHLSASKWQKDDSSNDYSSLPHISQSSVPYLSNGSRKHEPLSANKSERNVNHCSANSRKKSSTSVAKLHSKYTYSPRVKNVVLPPIQNLYLDEGRSVSSTPRKFNSRPLSNKFHKYSEEKSKNYLNFLEKN